MALLADSVGLALLVVLDSLSPAERLAFVLHDMFELPFDDIASMVSRTPVAARQLASRARRRVKGAEIPTPDPDLPVSARSSTRSSGPLAKGTSTLSSRSSIRTSSCAPTSVRTPCRLGGHPRSGSRRRPGARLPGASFDPRS